MPEMFIIMAMLEPLILQSLLTGLSTGAFCLSSCLPFVGSFLAANKRSSRRNSSLLLLFLAGRFLGYMAFGSLFGWLGSALHFPYARIIADAALIALSLVLLLYLFKVIRHREICVKGLENHNALLIGFLLGVNICPPFLLSLTYVFSLKSVALGILYFSVFFLASSIYFFPVLLLGALGKIEEVRKAARISGIAAAIMFMSYGIYSIVKTIF